MKPGLPILFTASAALCACVPAQGANVSYAKVTWNRIPANVVYVNTASPNVHVTAALARKGTGSSERFSSMVKRLQPAAAITGTFFCTKSLQPTGDIVIEGKRMHAGSVGTGFCVMDDGHVEFKRLKDGRTSDWQGCRTVICAGPTLVRGGKIALAPKSEGFKDPGIFMRKRRTAVGLTEQGKLLLVSVDKPIHLSELAGLMLHLGATDALDLDGGSSTALYCQGKTVSSPGRTLTNLLVVYESPAQYAAYRSQLAPHMPATVVAVSTPSTTAPPASDFSDDIMGDLFPKLPKLTLSDTLRLGLCCTPSPRESAIQMISARPQ